MYDYIIVTHLPAFYKVNLYNELSKKFKILVIYLGKDTLESRSKDFVKLDEVLFEYKILYDGYFQKRNKYKNILSLRRILFQLQYKRIIVGGWDLLESWYLAFFYDKSKNSLALESTVLESTTQGMKGLLKRIFLTKITKVFASGRLHKQLLEQLYFEGDITITKGVGIINKPLFEKKNKIYNNNFLFIGRLATEKNVTFLINTFNTFPDHKLSIVGTGPLENELKKLAKNNISFLGSVNNQEIKKIFLENDFLILPSISEPWGLVVEESLYFGIPVIISATCGASELIQNDINGYVIDTINNIELNKIINIMSQDKYLDLLNGVCQISIESKDKLQVNSYDL